MWKAKSVFPNRGTKKAYLISCIKIKQDNLENQSVRATPYTIQESTEETQRDVLPLLNIQKLKSSVSESVVN